MSSIDERLKKFEDVSSKNKDSIKDLQSDVKILKDLQSDDDDPRPPFTINSLLKLCWGLSLSLSKDSNQQKVGGKFMDAILELWKRRSATAPVASKSLNKNQQIKSEFIENLIARLTATVRNIGFVKDSHSEFLDEQKARYDAKAEYYQELSEFTSVKKEGIIPKLVTFVGGGSMATFATNMKGIFSTSGEQYTRL